MSDVAATLAERGGRYGAFIDHATIAQGIIDKLHAAPNWSKLDPDMKQALHVIADKMARILNGDPYYEDNWHDIQGYAKLVETRILATKEEKEPEYPGVTGHIKTNDIPLRNQEDTPCCGENRSSGGMDMEDSFLSPSTWKVDRPVWSGLGAEGR